MALAMLITIGGVYATWNYHEGAIQETIHSHFAVSMGEVTHATQKGELKMDASGLKIQFDNRGDNVPEMTITGSVYVYFKPAANVDDDVAQGNINLKFKLTASTLGEQFTEVANKIEYKFDEEDAVKVFSKFVEEEQVVRDPESDLPSRLEEGTYAGWYCYEISAATIATLIEFNTADFADGHALNSYREFQAFEKVFHSYNLGITVCEDATPAA